MVHIQVFAKLLIVSTSLLEHLFLNREYPGSHPIVVASKTRQLTDICERIMSMQ